ncbi:MAG: cytochrome c oxidase subunit 3 [Deltaproteobacteria bacterium]|nr:cytochrome c oxidase subunit 3 [Deltaproteobacteria bacterium]
MTSEAAARVAREDVADVTAPVPAFGEGPPPPSRPEPVISNARLGLMMFIGAEVMFFAGLIGAFLVLRLSSEVWPPVGQPRLPVWITGFNTLVLLSSGVAMHRAWLAASAREQVRLSGWLLVTAVLGAVFLTIQGYEWVRLIGFGLTMRSGLYGSTFYALIGLHGLHVLGALVWVGVVWMLARRGRFAAGHAVGVETCKMYWLFVVALWPVLYGLVYLY